MTQPTPNPSRERPGKTRAILDAALETFLEVGYSAAVMDHISARAGVSKATVYTRFSSKQTLFIAVIERECEACAQRMALAGDSPAGNLAERLHHIADTLLDIITLPRNLAIQRLVIAEWPRFPELGEAFYESGPAVTLRNLTGFMQREQARGTLRGLDAAAAAQHFLSMLRGDIQLRALLGVGDLSPQARARVAERSVDDFLALYGNPQDQDT